MSYILAIIDMQPNVFFSATNIKTIQNIVREIKQANKDMASVLFVEYGDDRDTYDPTHEILVQTCKQLNWQGKSDFNFIVKKYDDGSPEIIDAIDKLRLPQELIRVCGVNTDACVARTVEGLDQKLNKFGFDGLSLDMRKDNTIIEIVWDACNTDSPYPLKHRDLTRHCSKNVFAVNLS